MKLDNWREERYIHCERCGKLHLEDIKCSCELDERNDTENIVYIIGLNSHFTTDLPQIIRCRNDPGVPAFIEKCRNLTNSQRCV